MFLPGLERMMGNAMNNTLGKGFGKTMAIAEDPFNLRSMGIGASPWTHMYKDRMMDEQENQDAANVYAKAMM